MGLSPKDFDHVRASRTPNEASQRLESLKDRFKVAFRKMIPILHPDRNGGDPTKTEQFRLLLEFSAALDRLQVPRESPRVTIHEVIFHNPIPRPRAPTRRVSIPGAASVLASMRPAGVDSNRGR